MPANDFVFVQDSAQRNRIEPKQLKIFFEKLFLISSVLNSLRSSLVSAVPRLKNGHHSTTLTRTEHPLDSVWDILQELVYEGRREPRANLHKLETAIRQKWNEIDDQTIKKDILQWKSV